MPVNAHAATHVSQHIPEISPHISAPWDKHPDWATLRDSIVKRAALAAKYGYPWDETVHVKRLTSIWEHQRLIAVEKLKPPTCLVRSDHGHWGQRAHLLRLASHLPAGASADLELPRRRRAYRNDSPVLADLRSRTDRVLPAV